MVVHRKRKRPSNMRTNLPTLTSPYIADSSVMNPPSISESPTTPKDKAGYFQTEMGVSMLLLWGYQLKLKLLGWALEQCVCCAEGQNVVRSLRVWPLSCLPPAQASGPIHILLNLCTRTGHPGRVLTPNQLVRSGFDHWVPVTPDLIAFMVCDQSIIWHYSRIIGIIAKYHITVLFRGINRPLLGFPLCL